MVIEGEIESSSILIVGDDDTDVGLLAGQLAPDFRVLMARSQQDVQDVLEQHASDLGVVVAGQWLGGRPGLEVLASLGERHPEIERIGLVADDDLESVVAALNARKITGFIRGRGDDCGCRALVRAALERHALRKRLKQAQLQCQRSEQNAVLAFLSAGLGHEISNPTAVLKMNLCVVLEKVDDIVSMARARMADALADVEELAADAHAAIDDCLYAVEMLTNISHDLRILATPPEAECDPIPTDVNAAVARALRFLSKQVAHHGTIEASLAAIPLAMADDRRLAQVVINLVTNALQALDSVDDGRVKHIRVQTFSTDSTVGIRVEDNGCGIPAEVLPRVFDPFFTTKRSDAGVGIGLSLCRKIMTKWGGEIDAKSSVGQGSTFSIQLRTAQTSPSEGRCEPGRVVRHFVPVGTVLVVDDDPMILRAIERSLAHSYQVETAESGQRAIELIRARHHDAVLCDLHMPPPDGREVYRVIKELRPALAPRVAFMTGGPFVAVHEEFLASQELGSNPVIRKPFSAQTICHAVADLIVRA